MPWYRFFWAWFVFGLVGVTVIAGIATLVIAVRNQDSLVKDEWYQDGQAINRRLERDRRAVELGIRASLAIDAALGTVELELGGETTDALEKLQLELSHPTHAERDRVIVLERVSAGRFEGVASPPLQGRWYAVVAPIDAAPEHQPADDWRLRATIVLPSASRIVFGEGT